MEELNELFFRLMKIFIKHSKCQNFQARIHEVFKDKLKLNIWMPHSFRIYLCWDLSWKFTGLTKLDSSSTTSIQTTAKSMTKLVTLIWNIFPLNFSPFWLGSSWYALKDRDNRQLMAFKGEVKWTRTPSTWTRTRAQARDKHTRETLLPSSRTHAFTTLWEI